MTTTTTRTSRPVGAASPPPAGRRDARFLAGFVVTALAVSAVVAGGLAWIADRSGRPGGTPQEVAVTLKDFAVGSSKAAVTAGLLDVAVRDDGPQEHEYLIFRTDLPADELPLGDDGRVDEDADGATKVFDSGDNIAVGDTTTFHTALTAGSYVFICNLPGHYRNGMHTPFVVTPSAVAPASVAATVRDFAVATDVSSARAGLVDFAVTDDGPQAHEFLIFRTDLRADRLPLGDDGRVNEDADGATKVFDSGDNIAVGDTTTFETALPAGRYVLICNLPKHYVNGMHVAFTVT